MRLHNICYVGMGVVLFVHPAKATGLHTALLGGLLLGAGVAISVLSVRRRRSGRADKGWYVLSSIRDIFFGVLLLADISDPLRSMVNILGAWAIFYAFLQAIEAMFYFLGTQGKEDKAYWIEVIHGVCVLIAGGIAFALIMRPADSSNSFNLAGSFLIALGLAQSLLTYRLRLASVRP